MLSKFRQWKRNVKKKKVIFALTLTSLTTGQVGDAGGVLCEWRPRGKRQICSRDTSHRTSPTLARCLTTCCSGRRSPSICLSLSLLPSFLALISAFHTNNHPDTCRSRCSFSRWNVLTFNLLCLAGNLSHTHPEFLSFWVSVWCGWCIFLVTPVFFFFLPWWQKTCGGGSGTALNQGVSSPQVVKDTVNIQIGDVNDNAPTFHGQPYTVHIPEVSNQSINFYL